MLRRSSRQSGHRVCVAAPKPIASGAKGSHSLHPIDVSLQPMDTAAETDHPSVLPISRASHILQ